MGSYSHFLFTQNNISSLNWEESNYIDVEKKTLKSKSRALEKNWKRQKKKPRKIPRFVFVLKLFKFPAGVSEQDKKFGVNSELFVRFCDLLFLKVDGKDLLRKSNFNPWAQLSTWVIFKVVFFLLFWMENSNFKEQAF